LDGRRVVQFCACKADHEHNRAFARDPIEEEDDICYLKG